MAKEFLCRISEVEGLDNVIDAGLRSRAALLEEVKFFTAKLKKIKEKADIEAEIFWATIYPLLAKKGLIDHDYNEGTKNKYQYGISFNEKDRCVYKTFGTDTSDLKEMLEALKDMT